MRSFCLNRKRFFFFVCFVFCDRRVGFLFVDIRSSFPLTVSRVAEILTGPLKHPVVPVPGRFVRVSFHS